MCVSLERKRSFIFLCPTPLVICQGSVLTWYIKGHGSHKKSHSCCPQEAGSVTTIDLFVPVHTAMQLGDSAATSMYMVQKREHHTGNGSVMLAELLNRQHVGKSGRWVLILCPHPDMSGYESMKLKIFVKYSMILLNALILIDWHDSKLNSGSKYSE